MIDIGCELYYFAAFFVRGTQKDVTDAVLEYPFLFVYSWKPDRPRIDQPVKGTDL